MVNKSLNSRLAAVESSPVIRARQVRLGTVDLAGLSPVELVGRYHEHMEQFRNSPEGKATDARIQARIEGLSVIELVRLCREVMRGGSI